MMGPDSFKAEGNNNIYMRARLAIMAKDAIHGDQLCSGDTPSGTVLSATERSMSIKRYAMRRRQQTDCIRIIASMAVNKASGHFPAAHGDKHQRVRVQFPPGRRIEAIRLSFSASFVSGGRVSSNPRKRIPFRRVRAQPGGDPLRQRPPNRIA